MPRKSPRAAEAPPAITPAEVAEFTREFSARIEVGTSLVRSLTEIEEQTPNPDFKRVIQEINLALQAGHVLSATLTKYPEVFDQPYIDAVRMGEVNGNLDLMLQDLSKDEPLLGFDEALQVLGTSTPTLYRLLKKGDLTGLRVGRQWRFRKSDLIAYMERKPAEMASASLRQLEGELEFFAAALENQGLHLPAQQSTTATSTDEPAGAEEQKIYQLLRAILFLALESNATDIHFDPQPDHLLVRLRLDGVLQELRRIPSALAQPLSDRLKVMSAMSLEEKRLPQDGTFKLQTRDRKVEARLSTVPTAYGESAVLRLISPSNVTLSLDQLNLGAQNLDRLRDWMEYPNGLILITGPSGIGKTTTLYSCLMDLNSPERKIATVEDPVELPIPGAVQVQVHRKVGLTFASALRALLRQDPDIVFAGELRDVESSEIAIQSALTGHLVFSTLPTNAAVDALFRLRDIGLEPFLLSAALLGILNQRLVRRLCPNCRKPDVAPSAALQKLSATGGYPIPAGATFYAPAGCPACRQTGFRGRIPLCELLTWSEALGEAYMAGASREDLTRLAIAGRMNTLFADGIRKAAAGETSVTEVTRILGVRVPTS